jgi:hypothetical protein
MGESVKDLLKWAMNYLGGCSIGDEGCEYLSRAQWHNLQIIFLGTLVEMKVTTTSAKGVCDLWGR